MNNTIFPIPPANFCENSRQGGHRFPGGRVLEIYTAPATPILHRKIYVMIVPMNKFLLLLNNDTPYIGLRSLFCCHDSSYTMPANFLRPRIVSHLLGAARYGPPRQPSQASLFPYTFHIKDVLQEIFFLPSSSGCHTHARKKSPGHSGVLLHAPHSKALPSVSGIPDVGRVSLVSLALCHHSFFPP